ncbi:MAG: hypothetical protein Q7R74_01330 [bacterium]|nr:hypothetical protein [bacterium]
MKSAGDFLSKFKSLTPPNDAVRKAVAKAVRAIAGVPVGEEAVTIARGVAFVECSSVAKSTIRSARGAILKELFLDLPKSRDIVRDIR